MKRFSLMAMVLLFSFSLFAQEQQGSRPARQGGQPGRGQRMTVEERAKQQTTWMKEELKLKDNQVAKVDSINLVFTKTQQVLFQSSEGDREKIRESMAGLEKEKEAALGKVLTSEQLATYKTKVKEMATQRNNRGGGDGERPQRRNRD
ncbi:MAG: DUF4890 domain-containing protein [Dysgonamonadaceae bacterium]|nr:DUF4890 domain-containing protein [Dysgonamonadaceae bacterium]